MISITELRHVLDPETLLDLSDDSQSGSEDTTIINACSDLAELEIRNRVGLESPDADELPEKYRDIWITLTVERLFERRRDSVPTLWKDRSTRARELLEDMKNSGTTSGSVTTGNSKPYSTRTPEDRAHQPDSLKKY